MIDGYAWQRLTRAATDLGHYNLAKLLTAAQTSATQRALAADSLPKTDRALVQALNQQLPDLIDAGIDPALIDLIRHAVNLISAERLVLHADAPPLWVCRVCGEVALHAVPEICPNCGAGPLIFQYFPAAFYLEPVPIDELLTQLARTPDWLEATLSGLSPDQAARRIDGAEGAWSLVEAAGHLLDSQNLIAHRVQLLLSQTLPDLNAKAVWQMGEASALSAADITAEFRASRTAMLDRLRGLPPADWQRIGRHTEFGEVTLQVQCSYFARHEQWHMAQISRIRRALG